ncbi:hypothetical protein SJAG_01533 [Schizosaccharomyces japonicus yFS275]|uniref:RBR-type E3 ubiquitin transferase n=1 Tax=Schizosaccharomyces japonicus (strain yFS275 / FY16936) TaxID=402676 RepID=B6JY74_SCHJY|nr:hypothetical protein SJAG_01533 [Schizosaccharomyces japonicus yFS275]EEB06492.2 hypothetical protein SJAG_01533 [Schizosaccharomyces japonicus yFS275]
MDSLDEDAFLDDEFSDKSEFSDFDTDDSGVSFGEDNIELNENESDGFTIGSKKKKAYDVDFKVATIQDLRNWQAENLEHIMSITGLTREQTLALFRYFRWNKERLLEKYVEDPERTLKQAGVESSDQHQHSVVKKQATCNICFDEGMLEMFGMDCGHEACKECYQHYLTTRIQEGESLVQCPEENCSHIVSRASFDLLLPKNVLDRYYQLLDQSFVDENDSLCWCPAPDCQYAILCHVRRSQLETVVPTVTCACGNQFCFGCGRDNHQPAICSLVKIWLQKCQDDSETANWIHANTKECPKCLTTIEKNGGCNHMTCKKCKYGFCWVCLGPWTEHGNSWYTCNRYDEKSSAKARDSQSSSRASLDRYLHYYNRFANHEQSAKLDRELYKQTQKRMTEMQVASNLSWMEVQFLKNAVDTLCICRQTLKWTYAFAFYLKRDNQTEIFEDNQRDLEIAVENLSELCESPFTPEDVASFKQKVLDRTVYVKSRREVLLDDTVRGLSEHRWTYVIDA